MGTRADFYIGRGENAEWLGSIAYNGYPRGSPANIIKATSEDEYRTLVKLMLSSEEDEPYATTPEMGWPWPWEDSCLTDHAYAWTENGVMFSESVRKTSKDAWHKEWFYAKGKRPSGEVAVFPKMKGCSAPAGSSRSGIMMIRGMF